MARIAYVLLCHANPDGVVAQANALTRAGDFVAIHFDKAASAADFKKLHKALDANPGVVFAKRTKCGWGEWSLVQATLNGLRAATKAFDEATHFYLISGDCSPIKSAAYIHETLDKHDVDYIEHHDFWESGWIQTGIKEERLHYRHFLNERKYPELFYTLIAAQKKLGLKRDTPKGLEMKIGSQWFCLRRSTVLDVFDFIAKKRKVVRFFKTVWIPDECFFQTLVAHLVDANKIRNHPPTFLMFSDYGKPTTFYADQKDYLIRQDRFFARKTAPRAAAFRDELLNYYASGEQPGTLTNDGKLVFQQQVQAGRVGARYNGRIWDRGGTVGMRRRMFVIMGFDHDQVTKLSAKLGGQEGIAHFGYIFEDMADPIINMGGLETSLEKRHRHRRGFMRCLYDTEKSDDLMFCLTPQGKYILDDFNDDSCDVRVLLVSGDPDSQARYALKQKLGEDAEYSGDHQDQIVRALQVEMRDLYDQVVSGGYKHLYLYNAQSRTKAAKASNQEALVGFLDLPLEQITVKPKRHRQTKGDK